MTKMEKTEVTKRWQGCAATTYPSQVPTIGNYQYLLKHMYSALQTRNNLVSTLESALMWPTTKDNHYLD